MRPVRTSARARYPETTWSVNKTSFLDSRRASVARAAGRGTVAVVAASTAAGGAVTRRSSEGRAAFAAVR